MRYRRRAASVIAVIALISVAMEFSDVLFPDLSHAPADTNALRPTATSIIALGYASMIAFNKSLTFEPTTKKWKRVALAVLAVAGVVLVLIRGFTVPYAGFVLSGLAGAVCFLWFDSDVHSEPDGEQDLLHYDKT